MKKQFRSVISFLLAVCMIIGSASFLRAEAAENEVDLNDGLLAHYDFENVSGTSVPNAAGTNSYGATISGSAAVVDLENVVGSGKALQLGSAADGMQLTDIVNASTSSFSVSLWYKASATSQSNINLVQAGTIGGSTGRTILILDPSAKYYTYLTGDNAKTTTASAVTATAWQHITVSYDQTANKVYFFVNGVADRADGLSLSGTALDTGDMIIGRHRNANEGQFNGLIDEVRVYNKVLSAEEAAAIYDSSMEAYKAPLVVGGEVTLTVDAGNTVRVIDSDSIFGINHRYAFNGYGSFDPENMKIKDDFRALYEDAGFGSIRYPGGTISNLFNWKTTIGPVEQRKDQIHGFYNNPNQGGIAPNFGLTEIGTFAESVDSEIVYVYSLGRGNAQDAADLIEYLNAKVGTNPNGGIDWAAVRAANGHEDPYNVRYFEIGNEMQQAWGGSDGTASQGYWTTSVSGGSEAAYIDGGTATFTKQYAVCEEDWNAQASKSTGEPNMVRYMRYANVNPKMDDGNGNIVDDPSFKAVNDGVSVFVGETQWTVVDSFANSGASDQHVVIDYSTGAIKFGNGTKGAIPAAGQQIYVSYSVEREGFIAVSRAMKETTDAINEKEGTNHEAYIYSSYETTGFINRMAERNANDLYDGLTIHPYSGTPDGSGAAFYDSAMLKAENVGIRNVQNYVDMMPADKVPVISEYGIFRSTDALVRSQTHAIYIAKVLMEYVRLGSPYIQKHCLIDWYSSGADSLGPTQQAVIQAVAGSDADTKTGEGTFTFFSTPSAHVFKMLNSGFGDRVVFTEFSSVPTMSNGAKTLSALASKDNDGTVYVAIVNASREERYELALDLENIELEGAVVTAQVLTADSFDAQNSPEDPDNVSVTTENVSFDGDSITYTIPQHTFVVLKIDPAADPVQTRDISLYVGESVTVSDNSGYYVGMDTSDLDTSVATVVLSGAPETTRKDLSDKVTSLVSGKQYVIVNTRAGKTMTSNSASADAAAGAGSGLSLSGTTANVPDEAIWTITGSGTSFAIQAANGSYVDVGTSSASLISTAVQLTVEYNGSDWTIGKGTSYLNDFGGNGSCAAGWDNAATAKADPGSQWTIYEVTLSDVSARTDITFTGVGEGSTSLQIGDVIYNIQVTAGTSQDGHNYVNGFCVDAGCGAYQPAVLKNGVYEISNGGQLYWFAALVNGDTDAVPGIVKNADANAVLTCDITVNDAVLNNGALAANTSALRSWVPIGRFIKYNNFVSYTGTFDGNGHTISGLYDSNAAGERIALIGVAGDGAVVRDLGLKDTYFSGKQYVAGIVAEGYSSSADAPVTIANCWTENMAVEADVYYAGGIAGHVLRFAEITDCRNEAAVSGGNSVGGIIGFCGDGTNVSCCSNEGAVSGETAVGGIAGINNSGNFTKELSRCYNAGPVAGASEVGGVVGQNSSVVEDCYNTGDVTGNGVNVGGVIGYNLNKGARVEDCYNTDDVAAPVIGGSSNVAEDAVENCFYLADRELDEIDGTTAETAEAFASGEITWLLNHETDEGELVWFQTIGEDAYPVFEGDVVHHDAAADPPYYNEKAPVEPENDEVIRLAGANRYATALMAADEMKAALGVEKFDAIIIASGNDFADALAGSYLATVKNAPILLSYGGTSEKYAYLDTDNIDYIKENLSANGVVYILGGKNAVPELYETGLAGITVKRLGGANRFETNILILEEAGIASGAEVLVCTATNFADSLSASATGLPILLVWNDRGILYGNQPEFLDGLKEKNCSFTILGGESAVSAKLADEVGKYGEVDRLAGANRMETSVLVAQKYFDAPETAVLAYAWNYPDGLCGGSLAYALKAPLILTMPKYEKAAVDYAAENGITVGYVLGGDGLVTDEIVRAVYAMDAEDQIIVK